MFSLHTTSIETCHPIGKGLGTGRLKRVARRPRFHVINVEVPKGRVALGLLYARRISPPRWLEAPGGAPDASIRASLCYSGAISAVPNVILARTGPANP
jgi:hypothetical protein